MIFEELFCKQWIESNTRHGAPERATKIIVSRLGYYAKIYSDVEKV